MSVEPLFALRLIRPGTGRATKFVPIDDSLTSIVCSISER